jgi:hypothetical protein
VHAGNDLATILAHALHLLGDIAIHADCCDAQSGEAHCRRALHPSSANIACRKPTPRELGQALLQQIPPKRLGKPEDVARAVPSTTPPTSQASSSPSTVHFVN